MKNVLIAFLFIFSKSLISQNKKTIYIDNNKDYVVFFDNDVKTSSKNIQGTEIDVFAKTSNDKLNYTLLISKIFKHNFINGNLLDESYEDYFSSTCKCTVLDKELVYYNNLETLSYKIKIIKNDNVFIGYIDSFVSNSILYNILFLAFEKDFEEEEQIYPEIMNTLIINGKATINGYN